MNFDLTKDYKFKLTVPLYKVAIDVRICDHKSAPFNAPEGAFGGYHYNSGTLWINREEILGDINFIQTLSHECVHASFGSSYEISNGKYPSDVVGEEMICYIQDFLISKIIKKVSVTGDK